MQRDVVPHSRIYCNCVGAGGGRPGHDSRRAVGILLGVLRPQGVSKACIALQDAYGGDVDMVLFALWCARRGRHLDGADLDAIDAAVTQWRETAVQPPRNARRALKPPPLHPFDPAAASSLWKQLLSAEIKAERQQQAAMEALAPTPGDVDPGQAARDNLACFARHAGVPPDAPPFAILLRAFT